MLPDRYFIQTMQRAQLVIFFFISLVTANAQNQAFSINWESPQKFTSENIAIEAPFFEGAVHKLPGTIIPDYCDRVVITSPNVEQVLLTDIVVTPLTNEEAALFSRRSESVSEEFTIEYGITGKNRQNYLSYCLATIRRGQDGNLEKLLSANLAWTYNSSETFKTGSTSGFAPNSVLASGKWYKVAVSRDAIYKLTPQYMSDIGMGSGIPINTIGVFGNGMGELPERNATFRYDDLQENALFVHDANSDGVFNGNDYILFYGRGSKRWSYNATTQRFSHQNHHYANKNFYFITSDQGSGKQISPASYPPGTPTQTVTAFDDFAFIEEDNVNLIGTGRKWFGDLFDFKLSYNYTFKFPNLVQNEPVEVYTEAVARSTTSGTTLRISNGQTQVSNLFFSSVGTGGGDDYVKESSSRDQFNASSSTVTITATYNNSINPSAVAWLDYIEVTARRELTFSGGAMFFRDTRTVAPGSFSKFEIDNAPSTARIWDVTDHINPKNVSYTMNGPIAEFTAPTDELREFVMVQGTSFDTPEMVGSVANQDLHGMAVHDMIIVSHPDFLTESQRLADFHASHDGITAAVVNVRKIYNEFSSGGQDITAIKDFMRSLYEKAASPSDAPKYLLLFGDASYDYKNRVEPNHNYVPIYESTKSYSLYNSYSTDDYYGFLDPTEGVNMRTEILDLSIGRFPVTSVSQARAAVDKVIHYSSSELTYEPWKNNLLFVSDDVDQPWEMILTNEPDYIARRMERDYPQYNVQKIYSDSYIQKSSAGSQRYPEARLDLFRKVESGNLITTYVGHGGEVGWATERILQLDDVNGWDNLNNMPVFTTITCEFSRLDDPVRVSAGEQLFRNKKGGAISLFSTTRVVFVNSAISINRTFFDTVFGKVDGQYQTMGDIIRATKNQVFDEVRLKFSLLGDPALKMSIPEYHIELLELNGTPMGQGVDTLKALSKINMVGQVVDEFGNKLTSFNGRVNPLIFDKSLAKVTLMNDNQGVPIDFYEFENVIYRGKVGVQNGDFQFDFIVPLDINYNIGKGKANFYSRSLPDEGHGSDTTLFVGGLNTNASADNFGPLIDAFINDRSFVNGGITSPDPVLYVELFDTSGINTVGNGIGHDLIAILDDNTNNTMVLNDFYEADLDSYQSGKIRFPLYDLEPGDHQILVRVWDVYNNPSETLINFKVLESTDLQLSHVLNWPNPFTTYTEFQFEHNRASEPLEVQVQVYTVAGQLIKTINQTIMATGNRITGIAWDGRDQYGDPIGKGVYVYRLRVRSTVDQSSAEKTEKLVILN